MPRGGPGDEAAPLLPANGESSESLERPAEREGTAPAPSPRPPRASGVEASPEASPSGQPAAGGQAAGAGGNARRVRTAAGQVAAASLLNLRPVLIAEAVFRTAQILTSVFVLAFTTRGSGCDAAALLRVWLMGHIVRCVLQLRVIVFAYAHREAMQAADADPASADPDFLRRREAVGRLKNGLEMAYSVWLMCGAVWIWNGSASCTANEPVLAWTVVAYLALAFISRFCLPLVFCGLICCCLPCALLLVTLLHGRLSLVEGAAGVGATESALSSLPPPVRFKAASRAAGDASAATSGALSGDLEEGGGQRVSGTAGGRELSAEDAVCAICLSNYSDGVEIRYLPCSHHFEEACIKNWLRLNFSCPVCRSRLPTAGTNAHSETSA